MSSKRPPYLSDLLPPLQRYQQNQGYFQSLLCRTKSSKTLFLLYTISQWNKLDPEIRRIGLCVGFQKKNKKKLSFIKPTENKAFSIYYPSGIKLLHRSRVNFSHLNV